MHGSNELPRRDDELPAFLEDLGLPGIFDVHVHFMPDRMQEAVWAHFDRLEPRWPPLQYRVPEAERLDRLSRMGVRRHTALAYAHKPGMAQWLNRHTLGLAARHPQVVPTFTLYPEPGVTEYVTEALAGGGACLKVHLQVGKFDLTDPMLAEAWLAIEEAGIPVVLHAGAVADGSGGEDFCGPAPVRRLLDRRPDLRLIVAHLGMPQTAEFLDLAAEHPQLRFDTAMALVPSPLGAPPPWLAERIEGLEARVLFGSDMPSLPHPVAAEVAAAARLGLGDEWLRQLLWGNAADLFGPAAIRP